MVRPKIFALLKDLVAPVKPGEAGLGVLLKALRDFYSPKKNVLAKRYTFWNWKQLVGKTLAEYIAALNRLATLYNFGDTLEELCDQFICGISNKELHSKLLNTACKGILT